MAWHSLPAGAFGIAVGLLMLVTLNDAPNWKGILLVVNFLFGFWSLGIWLKDDVLTQRIQTNERIEK